jgi:hypothetical protein
MGNLSEKIKFIYFGKAAPFIGDIIAERFSIAMRTDNNTILHKR